MFLRFAFLPPQKMGIKSDMLFQNIYPYLQHVYKNVSVAYYSVG